MSGEKKLEVQTAEILTRESQTMLAVKQFIQPDTATHLRELHDNQDTEEANFVFGELSIFITAYKPDGTVDKDLWKLPLPGAWKVRIADQPIRS